RVAPARAIIARLQSLAHPGGAPDAAAEPGASSASPPPQQAALRGGPAPTAAPSGESELQLAEPFGTGTDTALVKLNAELLLASESRADEPAAPEAVAPAAESAVDRDAAASPSVSSARGSGAATAATPVSAAAPRPVPVPVQPPAAAPSRAVPESAWTSAAALASASPLARGRAESQGGEGLLAPQPVPPGRHRGTGRERQDMARVDAELLDQLLNISGEASIARARLEQQLGSFDFNLGELSRTVTRLKEQLRSLEIETEAQILHKHE